MTPKQRSDHSPRRGFTIVELLIVIVVIGILAAIVIVAYSGIQSKARDASRVSSVQAMHTALSLYYVDNGSFPTTGQIIGPTNTWPLANLIGVNASILVNPSAPSGTVNSYSAGGSAVTASNYSYYSVRSDGSLCTVAGQCTDFRLAWRSESTGGVTGYRK